MAKTRQQKEEAVQKLESTFKNALSAVFVGFSHMNVADETSMRRGLRAEGVHYTVAKKTLVKRALESVGLTAPVLEGELAIAHLKEGDDATAPARLVFDFSKKLTGAKVAILGGVFEGRIISREEMNELATIPSMLGLRGMFLNVLNSPIQRTAMVLSEIAKTKQG